MNRNRWPEDICNTKEEYIHWNEVMHQYKKEYYLGTPTIPDSQYDLFERMLEWVEKKHPEWITKDSVTQYVGYKINELN